MSRFSSALALQKIEKLRLENSKLREEWLELSDEMLSFTGLPGHLHRLDVKMKELKSLLIRLRFCVRFILDLAHLGN